MRDRTAEAVSLFVSLTEPQQADIMALVVGLLMQEKTRPAASAEREAVKHGND